MAEVNLTLGDPIEVKVTPAEGATNVTVASAPQNVVQVQAAIATNGLQGADGAGVPTSPPGATGQALVKSSPVANATEWAYIEKLHATVKNTTGSTISAGSVVYAAGVDGSDILVALADASDSSKMPAIGFVYSDIAHNGTGDIVVAGSRTQDIQGVTGADEGKNMYVSSSTPGAVTVTKPAGSTNFVQSVGVVLRADGTTIKEFKVSCVDSTNDIPNLDSGHFFLGGAANTTSPYELPISSPTNGQLLKANADGNLVFVNANDVTKNIGTVNLTTTETTRNLDIIEDGHLNIRDAQDDTIFYIDEATKRVGINTTTLDKPAALFINGDVLLKDTGKIGVEGGDSFTIGKIGSAAGVATVNVTGDLSVSGNCTIDTNLKFGTGGNQLHANTNNTFEFGKNGNGSANYKFNSDVGTVTFDNTTDVELKNAGGLKLFNGSNSIAVKSPSLSGSYTLTLPNSSGTDGYVLKTDGSGTTSWVDVTAVSDAILDTDFSGASGLMKKVSAGTYAIAAADTDYQSVLSEGAFVDGDKTKITRITVSSNVNLDNAVFTTTSDVSSASFVDTDDTFGSPTNNLVPSQLAVKTYVDSHVKTAIYSDASDNPQLASGVTAGEVRTLIDLEDSDIRAKISSVQNSASGNGTLSYNQGSGVISYTPPDLSSYLTSAPPVTLANTNYLSLNGQELTGGTVPIGSGGTGATSAAGARAALDLEDSDIRGKFSAGTGITISGGGEIASTVSDTNTQNTTTLSFQDSGDDIVLRNTTGGAGSGNQDININAGSNITLTHTDSNNITIAATTNVTGLSAVVEDTTPSLGGNLNVNGNSLISPTNGDILVNPNGTGKFRVEHDSEVAIRSTKDAGVELFHNNTKKFETLSTGINVSGTADISGYVNPTGSNSGVRINAGQTLGAAGLHSGAEILDSFFASASLTAGKLYYAGSSAWALADKDAESTASGLLGIATDSANANEMVVKGVVRVATLSGSSPAKGDIVYVGDDGNPTTDAPSSDGDIVRIIGYVVTAGQSRTIYFNPSPDFIEIA